MCKKIYPCDTKDANGVFTCPYAEPNSCTGMYFCRDHCGLEIDEAEVETDDDFIEPEIDESMNPYDGTYDWENDCTMIGSEDW